MKKYQLNNLSSGMVLVPNLLIANSLLQRSLGLLNHGSFAKGEGLLIRPCSGVHTFGMRFSIDIIFFDADMRVLRIVHALKPWRMYGPVWSAKCVLELPVDSIYDAGTREGDHFEIITGTEH